MSAVVWVHANDPSAFYRLTEPARVLGVRVVEEQSAVGDADTIITNRPLLSHHAALLRMWKDEGRRIVVDMDDDFDAIPVTHHMHGRFPTDHLHRACELADVVTTSTPALVERYGHGHGVVLRNGVPESYLSIMRAGRRDPAPWVGWYASLGSHPDDPAMLGDSVAQVCAEVQGAEFVYAGPELDFDPLTDILGVEPRMLGFFSMIGLLQVVAEFDVGVVPLDLSPFNRAKSWLKGLEMAALGVPVVASPTEEYRRLAALGGCVTAATPDDWYLAVRDPLKDEEMHRTAIARGRAFAATQTYEQRADEWRSVWLP